MRNWLPQRFREFFSRAASERRDADLDAEMQSHIAESIRERTDRGESPKAARDAARKEFGNVTIVAETTREMWGWRWLDVFAQDLHYAARALRRNAGFSAAVILALALGIGVNVTMFSLADLLLLHYPAHISDPKHLFRVKFVNVKTGEGQVVSDRKTFSELAENSKLIEVAGQTWGSLDFGRGAGARQIGVTYVTSNYFRVLGAPLLMGRAFSEEECSIDATAPLAIVSNRFWREHLSGNPNILGRDFWMGDQRSTIVGVAPKDFNGASAGSADFWLPFGNAFHITPGSSPWFETIARVRDGAPSAAAESEATSVTAHSERESGWAIQLDPYFGHRWKTLQDLERLSVSLAGVAFCVLLIACANVANLFLARLTKRSHELALRLHLGASRSRVAAHILAEILLLVFLGVALSSLLIVWGEQFIRASVLGPRFYAPALINWHVAAAALAFAVVATLTIGSVALIAASKTNAGDAMKRGGSLAAQRTRMRSALLLGQVAATLALSVGAALFVHSLKNVRGLDLGFDPKNLIVADMDRPVGAPIADVNAAYERLAERAAAFPGVLSVSPTSAVPFYSYGLNTFRYSPEDAARHREKYISAAATVVSVSFFNTMGIEPLIGRVFDERDKTGPPATVITEGLANAFWPGENPIGKCIRPYSSEVCMQIVGITRDISRRIVDLSNVKGELYLPIEQPSSGKFAFGAAALLIKTSNKPSTVIGQIAHAFANESPDSRFVRVQAVSDLFDESARNWTAGASLFSFFSGLALLLTAIGIYGLLAYSVRQRTPEIGVRMALGAQPGDVLRLITSQTMKLVAAGIVLGLAAAIGLSRLIASLLYNVKPNDTTSYIVASVVLAGVAILACWLPARRAMRVDPMQALRYE